MKRKAIASLGIAAVLLALALAGGAQAARLPNLKGRTIVAVTENAFTPLNFADPRTGKGIGWEYDAVNEMGRRLNAKTVSYTHLTLPTIYSV